MKEDVLEQIVEDYLQHLGYLTRGAPRDQGGAQVVDPVLDPHETQVQHRLSAR